jgi:hypothetical protein
MRRACGGIGDVGYLSSQYEQGDKEDDGDLYELCIFQLKI